MIEKVLEKVMEKVMEWLTPPTQHKQVVWIPVPVRDNSLDKRDRSETINKRTCFHSGI